MLRVGVINARSFLSLCSAENVLIFTGRSDEIIISFQFLLFKHTDAKHSNNGHAHRETLNLPSTNPRTGYRQACHRAVGGGGGGGVTIHIGYSRHHIISIGRISCILTV